MYVKKITSSVCTVGLSYKMISLNQLNGVEVWEKRVFRPIGVHQFQSKRPDWPLVLRLLFGKMATVWHFDGGPLDNDIP